MAIKSERYQERKLNELLNEIYDTKVNNHTKCLFYDLLGIKVIGDE